MHARSFWVPRSQSSKELSRCFQGKLHVLVVCTIETLRSWEIILVHFHIYSETSQLHWQSISKGSWVSPIQRHCRFRRGWGCSCLRGQRVAAVLGSGLASVFTEQLGERTWGSGTHFFPMGSSLQLLFSLPWDYCCRPEESPLFLSFLCPSYWFFYLEGDLPTCAWHSCVSGLVVGICLTSLQKVPCAICGQHSASQ